MVPSTATHVMVPVMHMMVPVMVPSTAMHAIAS